MKLRFRITEERTKKGKKLGGKMDSGQFGVFTNTTSGLAGRPASAWYGRKAIKISVS